ncbi:MAG: hypothetical protein ACLRT5_06255 [Lachnospiraceae bacterium]
MRKYAMKILEILHGGMLLATIYCIVIATEVTDDIRMLLRGLYLLIPCAVLSVAAARVRKFWQFFLAAILVGAGGYLAGGTTAGRIWLCFLVVVAAFSFLRPAPAGRSAGCHSRLIHGCFCFWQCIFSECILKAAFSDTMQSLMPAAISFSAIFIPI